MQLPLPLEIIRHLDQHITGHDTAKKALARNTYFHFLLCHDAGSDQRHHTLLLGPSGSGKTQLVKSLATFLGLPFFVCNAAALSPEGYIGESVSDMYASYANIHKSQQGIILLDELDKLCRLDGYKAGGTKVQQELLAGLDGNVLHVPSRGLTPGFTLDTRRILFVATGVFNDVEKVVQDRIGAQVLGFGSDAKGLSTESEITADDLIEYGLIPELVGRFSTIVQLRPLSYKTLRNILSHPKQSPIAYHRHLFNLHGIELDISTDVLDRLARQALDDPQGIRVLKRNLTTAFLEPELRLPELENKGITHAHLSTIDEQGIASFEYQKRTTIPNVSSALKAAARIAQQDTDFLKGADETALVWWNNLVKRTPEQALRALEALNLRRIPLGEYMEAFRNSQIDSLEANIYYSMYLRSLQSPSPPRTPALSKQSIPKLEHDLLDQSDALLLTLLTNQLLTENRSLDEFAKELADLKIVKESQLTTLITLAQTILPVALLHFSRYYRVSISETYGALADLVYSEQSKKHTVILQSEKLVFLKRLDQEVSSVYLQSLEPWAPLNPTYRMQAWQTSCELYPGTISKRNLVLCDVICSSLALSFMKTATPFDPNQIERYLDRVSKICTGVSSEEVLYLLLSHFESLDLDSAVAVKELASEKEATHEHQIHFANAWRHFEEGSLRLRVFETKQSAVSTDSIADILGRARD